MLRFDHGTARLLDDAYQGADIRRRRRVSFDLLDPQGGDRVLDLGCGNGLLTMELSRRVGDTGHVFGIDPSPDMLASAHQNCDIRTNVTLIEGMADSLPLADDSIDRAVALQVFEYVADPAPALAELRRVLRPGGVLVIADMHWDTLAWHSDDPERMSRMLRAWDTHLARLDLPARLPTELAEAGFTFEQMVPLTTCATRLDPDSLPMMMIHLIQRFAVDRALADPAEVHAWAREQDQLNREGRFFFSLTHFGCRAVSA